MVVAFLGSVWSCSRALLWRWLLILGYQCRGTRSARYSENFIATRHTTSDIMIQVNFKLLPGPFSTGLWPSPGQITSIFPSSVLLNFLKQSFMLLHTDRSQIQIYLDNWIPGLPSTAHSCSQHGLVTTWLMSEWPGKFIPMPKTFTLMETQCLSQCNDGPYCQTVETFNKAGKLCTKLLFGWLFKWNWRVLRVIPQCFKTQRKWL